MSLDNEDPKGRLDVLAYNISKRVVSELETYWGIPGIWDMCKGEVIEGIRDIRLGKVPEPLIEAARKVIRARKGNGC